MASKMLEQKYRELDGRPKLILVDLGYVNKESTQQRADAILAWGIGKKNFSLEGSNRLFVTISPAKLQKFLAAFPQVKEGSIYWQSTHNWVDSE